MKAAIIRLSSSHAMTYRHVNACFLVKPQLLTRG
jgi:hypothetical protein